MPLITAPYPEQVARWPRAGRHILAQFDDDSIVVYQAYRPEIGRYAATHKYFGPGFSLDRMSWIKPNFLWMMYRSGWGTKQGQEVTLAIWLQRTAFDEILRFAVPSQFIPEQYATQEDWKRALSQSSVRLQWDPDHAPNGRPVARRAIQLGLRGNVIARFAREWIVNIEVISAFVATQRETMLTGDYSQLLTPREEPYPVPDVGVAARVGIDTDASELTG